MPSKASSITKVPHHIAIIPDGNRRWAKAKHMPQFYGHKKGFEVMEKICYAAVDRGVKVMTFYAFSTENWKRSKTEVSYLFRLFESVFKNYVGKFNDEGIRLLVSGQTDALPASLIKAMNQAVSATAQNTRGTVHLCLNYGGRTEIVDAVKNIIKQDVPAKLVTKELISQNLYQPGLPEPDLIIRTSGEHRTSGYLLWQSEYAEYLFIQKHWPDFTVRDLDSALAEFDRRQRRFGA
jgi:undecaprenyl diphosphate synthase